MIKIATRTLLKTLKSGGIKHNLINGEDQLVSS